MSQSLRSCCSVGPHSLINPERDRPVTQSSTTGRSRGRSAHPRRDGHGSRHVLCGLLGLHGGVSGEAGGFQPGTRPARRIRVGKTDPSVASAPRRLVHTLSGRSVWMASVARYDAPTLPAKCQARQARRTVSPSSSSPPALQCKRYVRHAGCGGTVLRRLARTADVAEHQGTPWPEHGLSAEAMHGCT
jgi:hypothetical protein